MLFVVLWMPEAASTVYWCCDFLFIIGFGRLCSLVASCPSFKLSFNYSHQPRFNISMVRKTFYSVQLLDNSLHFPVQFFLSPLLSLFFFRLSFFCTSVLFLSFLSNCFDVTSKCPEKWPSSSSSSFFNVNAYRLLLEGR